MTTNDGPAERGPPGEIAILAAIRAERRRQDAKWDTTSGLDSYLWLGIFTEEIGEAVKDLNDGHFHHMEEELVQAAAVLVAWLGDVRRALP